MDGWMNDRQGEEGERRKWSQECCCGAIVPRERDGGERGEEGVGRDAGLVASQCLQSGQGGAESLRMRGNDVTEQDDTVSSNRQGSQVFSAKKKKNTPRTRRAKGAFTPVVQFIWHTRPREEMMHC